MQTFLPYPSFAKSAAVLDRKRLGKQRVEVVQILTALFWRPSAERPKPPGWVHHPATQMWRGYEGALAYYGITACDEWIGRGYKDTRTEKILALVQPDTRRVPPWLGDPAFHAAHRSNLLRKAPEHYGQFGWTEPADLPYVWPV